MSNVTLIMTRTPLQEVNQRNSKGKTMNGRWGRMVVVKGAKVLSGTFTDLVSLPHAFMFGPNAAMLGALANLSSAVWNGGGKTVIPLGHKGVALETAGGGVEVLAQFDTLERFRTDDDKSKYYVQLKPRPNMPYEIRMDISKNVSELNGTGNCFRVHGHDCKNAKSGKAGILIHEAPHVGWLIGCIGPRQVNNRVPGNKKEASRSAMKFIFDAMGSFTKGKRAQLLVMDW